MATSKCAKCDNRSFELVEHTPRNSRFKFMFIQCSSCGSVVGTMDYLNIGAELEDMKRSFNDRFDTLESHNNALNHNIKSVIEKVSRLK